MPVSTTTNGQSASWPTSSSPPFSPVNPDAKIVVRNVATADPVRTQCERFGALVTKPEARSGRAARGVAFSDTLITN